MNLKRLCLIPIVLSVLLAGCATVPRQEPQPPSNLPILTWQKHVAQLDEINAWDIQGAVSIRQGARANMANLLWSQKGRQNYNISLFGPLGMGTIKIIGRADIAILLRSNKPGVTAASPELLMQKQLGWRLPVSNLYYWVRGLPTPNIAASTQLDDRNRLIHLNQAGWAIQYSGYKVVNNVELPTRIDLSNPRLQIRIVIRQWQI